jgi:hypothetical protein
MEQVMNKEIQELILKKIGARIQERAMRLCPIDEGFLKSHIYFKVEGNTVRIYTEGVDYADEMEYGKPPSTLNKLEKEDIDKWAKRHGLKSGKGIIWSVEHKGIGIGSVENPKHITSFGRDSYRPFLRPAVHQTRNEIKEMIKEAMK